MKKKIEKLADLSHASLSQKKEYIKNILADWNCQRWANYFLSDDVRLSKKQELAMKILPLEATTQILTAIILIGDRHVK